HCGAVEGERAGVIDTGAVSAEARGITTDGAVVERQRAVVPNAATVPAARTATPTSYLQVRYDNRFPGIDGEHPVYCLSIRCGAARPGQRQVMGDLEGALAGAGDVQRVAVARTCERRRQRT